ncbi:hypothetical protein L202_01485 [Cryptococcus amylolentus CBS 6039]|uniref:Uncharacterized protein n=1 Tax=Cryptococcus amylolentus CBS 6039 TaxID=1295533 RepID=A0A1E3I3X7_9TREE|nr:hypothetical protein L202_01485 [Cryptococcus amylolentus CBS 6039]ODN83324.1 hypothetical protein L202_01485 [Cryptococcus amylolentus CBS 6039]
MPRDYVFVKENLDRSVDVCCSDIPYTYAGEVYKTEDVCLISYRNPGEDDREHAIAVLRNSGDRQTIAQVLDAYGVRERDPRAGLLFHSCEQRTVVYILKESERTIMFRDRGSWHIEPNNYDVKGQGCELCQP